MKNIEEIKEKDFDANGFVCLGGEYLSMQNFNAARLTYLSKKKNLEKNENGIRLTDTVCLTLDMPKETFQKLVPVLETLPLEDAIKFSLKMFPAQTKSILRDMPTSLYENEEVAKEIFSAIKKNNEILNGAISVMHKKMKLIKEYLHPEQSSKSETTPMESYHALLKEYDDEKRELN